MSLLILQIQRLIINTARRYHDLDFKSVSLGLFEAESSPVDIAENLDFLLDDKADVKEIATLNEAVVNRIGELISKGRKLYANVYIDDRAGINEPYYALDLQINKIENNLL